MQRLTLALSVSTINQRQRPTMSLQVSLQRSATSHGFSKHRRLYLSNTLDHSHGSYLHVRLVRSLNSFYQTLARTPRAVQFITPSLSTIYDATYPIYMYIHRTLYRALKNTAGAVYPTCGLETIKPTQTVTRNSSVTLQLSRIASI